MLDTVRPHDALDQIGEGIFALDSDGRISYLNSIAQRLLSPLTGTAESRLLGHIIWEASPSFRATPAGRALNRAHTDRVRVECQVRDPLTGSRIELRAYPTASGLSVLLLEPSDPGAGEVLDSLADLYLVCDGEWRLTLVNRRAGEYLRFLGRSRDELLGQLVWDAIPGLAGSRFQAEAFRSVVEQSEIEFEAVFPPLNRWFSVRLTPSSDGVVACARDLTGKRRRSTSPDVQLGGSAPGGPQRFQSLVESIDDVVFQLDAQQRCVHLFGRWLQREGFVPDQFIGRTTREILGPAEAPLHESANLRALAGETVTYEWVLRTARGPRRVLNTLSPFRDHTGAITGVVGVGRDITARIESEQQVQQAQKMEAVGRFAGGVAHDLNNMMMIIMGFSDFLLGSLERGDPRRSDADEIRKAAERAMQLTRQLLEFSRHRVVARQLLSLNDVVTGMERMLRPLLGEDMMLVTQLATELGGVEADYGQMEQVVMNLALNAREAMGSGGRLCIETLNVDLAADFASQHLGIPVPAGAYVMLVVSDNGRGMTPEVKAHLFEPFFTTKPGTQNTGLGLATVYGIVAQSGGYIWVDSEVGKGATFKVCFPRIVPDPVADPRAELAPSSPSGTETILLVEDEDALRMVASRVLTERGYQVLEAANGLEALALAQRAGVDIHLVLTDMIMPEMGGQELADHVARMLPNARLMYMSGYSDADKTRRGVREPGEHFLQKPFSSENLAAGVRQALDGVRP